MSVEQCSWCRFGTVSGDIVNCRRHPNSAGVSPDYWCGEFKPLEQDTPRGEYARHKINGASDILALYCVDQGIEVQDADINDASLWHEAKKRSYMRKYDEWLKQQVLGD